MNTLRILAASLALAFVGSVQSAAAASDWPSIDLPEGARSQSIATELVFNGRPTRLYRFEADGSERALRDFFYRQFDRKMVENRVKEDLAIGSRRGNYFVTVQLHTAGAAQQGTVMVTRVADAPLSSAVAAETRRWLPPDSQVISNMQSEDGGRRALTVVAVNRLGVRANLDAVVDAMKAANFRVQRSDTDERRAAVQLSSDTEDAQVVVSDTGGRCSVLITRMSKIK